MFVFVFANLLRSRSSMAHPQVGPDPPRLRRAGDRGGASSTSVLLIIAIVGTTVAPWQLFFQQSNIIDKRITPRWINYERFDTVDRRVRRGARRGRADRGVRLRLREAPRSTAISPTPAHRGRPAHTLGSLAGGFFAIVLLNASLIGAAALTLSTSYAFGDMFGTKSSLHRSFSDARSFYLIFAALIAGPRRSC